MAVSAGSSAFLQTALLSPSPPILEVFSEATLARATTLSLSFDLIRKCWTKNEILLEECNKFMKVPVQPISVCWPFLRVFVILKEFIKHYLSNFLKINEESF